MNEKYNKSTADHYLAYRPPLHEMILKKCIAEGETFKNGLDIGCGTGASTITLAQYCSHVYGVEPSKDMLEKAIFHENITYLPGNGSSIPVPDKEINIVTFAGSLFYATSPQLMKEIKRVCIDNSLVIVYDFKVLFDEALNQFSLKEDKIPSNYDYEINFDEMGEFKKIISQKEQMDLAISSKNLAHTLLADSIIYDSFVEKYNVDDPYDSVLEKLKAVSEHWVLKADIFFSKYQL